MLILYKKSITHETYGVINASYRSLVRLMNPETNRVEFMGEPVSRKDLELFFNFSTRQQFSYVLIQLQERGALIEVNSRRQTFFYINPAYARYTEEITPPLKWLVDLMDGFQEEIDSGRVGKIKNMGTLI